MNPEHPPLVKEFASLPVLFLPRLYLPTDTPSWQERNQWIFGAELLYNSYEDLKGAQIIMFVGRLPMILIWAALGWLLYSWSRRRWGAFGGLFSLSLYIFDPNFLGHGHLVTTDVASALGFFATIWSLDRLWQRPDWRRLLLFGVIFATAQLLKFSTVVLWVIVPLLGLLKLQLDRQHFSWAWFGKTLIAMLVLTPMLTWAVYGFELKRIDTDPRIDELWVERQSLIDNGILNEPPSLMQRLVKLTDPAGATGRFVTDITARTVPGYSYWRGLFSTISHNYVGHAAFFLGEFSYRGWWDYFPVAMALKTPIITLLLIVIGLWFGLRRMIRVRRIPYNDILIALAPAMYFIWSLTSHINIGLRHIFPVYPFLFMALGGLGAIPWPVVNRYRYYVLIIAILSLFATSLFAWPNTIGYFNSLAGGTTGGHRYLLDSNLDWNQDIWRLKSFLKQHHIQEYRLALFGSIPRDRVFPEAQPMLTDQEFERGIRPREIVIISAGQLWNVNGPYHWLQEYQPMWRIGSSITVYDFR